MKNKIKVFFVMCALMLGTAVTSAAQTTYRTRNGQTVTVRRNGSRVIRRNGRTIVRRPNGRTTVRRNVGRGARSRVQRGRTYRLSNGRYVTVLPNGRRIYRN